MTLVELKQKLTSQVKELIKVDDFRVTYARFDESTKGWGVTISYIVETQPDLSGRKFKLEKYANITTDSDGKILSITAF